MSLLNLFRVKSPLFEKVLREYFAFKARGLKDSTLEKHRCFYNNIARFLMENNLLQIQIHEVKVKHMEQMRQWLLDNVRSCRKGKACTLEHASRHIEHCQNAFDYAVLMEYYSHNPIDVIKCQRDKTDEPVPLDKNEVAKIQNSKFSSKLYRLVVDLILFQSFTGINYIDLWTYEIKFDQGMWWITGGRGKNGNPYSAEFNQFAREIHEKYNGVFPHITNQAYNRVLKKIAFALNIDKDITSGVGRKTYATLRYDQGMSVDAICDEIGNTPSVLNKHYIVRGKNRIKNEIERIKGTPFLPPKLTVA